MSVPMIAPNGDRYEADNEVQAEMDTLRGSRRADTAQRPAPAPAPAQPVAPPPARVQRPERDAPPA